MNAEEELLSWLNREDKTALENLNFGIKAIKSAEFVFSSKYQIVLKWFADKCNNIFNESFNEKNQFETIEKFLEVKYPISLVSHSSCSNFIENVSKFSIQFENSSKSRRFTEILFLIIKHEICNNFSEKRHRAIAGLLKCIFQHYEIYLQENSKTKFRLIYEKNFFDQVIKYITNYIKQIYELSSTEFAITFKNRTLRKLIEVVLLLKENNLEYFDDILEIEKLLFSNYEKYIFDIHTDLPIHIHLINFECSLINFKGNVIFYQTFIKNAFLFAEKYSTKYLMILIYILELLKKYEVNLNFEIDSQSVLKFIGNKIEEIASKYVKNNVNEIMWLLCSTVRLHPLILEYSIFKIAVQIITSPKSSKEMDMYENFIVNLLSMSKILNRPDKFVGNLLRALNNYLKENKISKKNKRKSIKNVEGSFKKIKTEENSSTDVIMENEKEEINIYFKILLKDFQKNETKLITTKSIDQKENSFTNIAFALPLETVGKQFSKFISTLVTKPSLCIWKTILFELQNFIKTLQEQKVSTEFEETILFTLDFTSALLSQYFAGTKVVEHYDKFSTEIENNIKFTKTVLKEFGQFLLNIEHNNRIVNTFLQVVQNFGMFCLISLYYPIVPETNETSNNIKTIYDFLSSDEWILIEQRIANFGDFHSKYNINVLSLHKLNAKILLQNNITTKINIKSMLSSSTFLDPEQIINIFLCKKNSWLIQHLFESEKTFICNTVLEKIFENELDFQSLKILMEDRDCLQNIITGLYEHFGKSFNTKKSVLHILDFNKYKLLQRDEKFKLIIETIKTLPNKSIKNVENIKIEEKFKIFDLFNAGSCNEEIKIEIFVLNLALYRDLINTTAADSLIKITYDIFESLLFFKPYIKIFNHISFELLTKIVSPSISPKFYELLFQNMRNSDQEYSEKCLLNVISYLKTTEENMNEDQIKIMLILIHTLKEIDNRKLKPFQNELLLKFENYFLKYIMTIENCEDDLKKYVGDTLAVFSIYLNNALVKANKKEFEISEDFRKICKIYIGYSIKYSNQYCINIIKTTLTNRQLLHFDPDEIQLILQKYWELIQTQLKVQEFSFDNINEEEIYYKEIMDLIVDNSSNFEFRNLLLEIGKDTSEENIVFLCRIINKIAKLQFNKVKGAILNEYFKTISLQVLTKLEKDSNQQYSNFKIVIILLNTMKSLCENRAIPLSVDHIDGILSFLMDINIKQFILTDNNENIFKNLYDEMINLCITLIKSRNEIISDRIPQIVIIYQDLLQAICWYKSERQKDIMLKEDDLQDLEEFAAKLENIMHLLAKHELNLKRVSPYLLTFIINLMVSDKRSTTLYNKIKTHMESICYMLIRICDHRVGPFILRCTNDATRHVYENLVKDFNKYHKFKGKV